MQHSTTEILPLFDKIFNKEKCLEIAKKNRFVIRSSSRIKGHEFLKMLILPSEGVATDSLVGMCDRLTQFNPDADISASALSQRMNHVSSVRFMKDAFAELINLSCSQLIKQEVALSGLLSYFKNVYIQDSTLCELNEIHSKKYTGTRRGTNCCKSQLKIDFIYNYSTGQIVDLNTQAGKIPDQALAKNIYKHLGSGDLIIRDLGYFSVENLRRTQEIFAYYLSRLPNNVLVFLKKDDEQPIDLGLYINRNHPNDALIELPEVYISAEKVKTRLVIYRVPPAEQEKRLRRSNKHAKETGRTTSKAKKSLMGFSIFVTNIPSELISKETIGTIYRLRWEIELIFKQWKSKLKIDYLKGTSKHRIDCLILSRLCMVIITAMFLASFMRMARDLYGRELSSEKTLSYLIRKDKLCDAIAQGTMDTLVKKLIKNMPKMLMKDKRVRRTMQEMSISSHSYYECAA